MVSVDPNGVHIFGRNQLELNKLQEIESSRMLDEEMNWLIKLLG